MRLWSIESSYLDTPGLVALWREALLAKKVLEGGTVGYKNHPQLYRFQNCGNPLDAVNFYLNEVWVESHKRGFQFNKEKIDYFQIPNPISVTKGQLEYEFQHLKNKLALRAKSQLIILNEVQEIKQNKLFTIIEGNVEEWERN